MDKKKKMKLASCPAISWSLPRPHLMGDFRVCLAAGISARTRFSQGSNDPDNTRLVARNLFLPVFMDAAHA